MKEIKVRKIGIEVCFHSYDTDEADTFAMGYKSLSVINFQCLVLPRTFLLFSYLLFVVTNNREMYETQSPSAHNRQKQRWYNNHLKPILRSKGYIR